MSSSIMISKKIIEEIKKRGLDPEDLIIEALRKTIKLDPDIIVEARLELAEKYLIDGKSMLEKDPIKSSEKLYKAAEECVKALTVYFSLTDILSKVEEKGGGQ
ncbi:MAG: PaREP1 family protein [Thaumarchaeota archaeon]|nr:PaREP1 family protein [Candidatus Geocrenenecus arthurdayi]MCL7391080.1 PaREP1 family protein [Candidatus Geocrenenecus arthurdayi]MCL7396916.1 PaREP1 family protein [Candidatus Geocrenenecus arthurdayi]MCL7403456.1 PaREP1 family protein [Candidatus Geocrenenecus arthurdayi]